MSDLAYCTAWPVEPESEAPGPTDEELEKLFQQLEETVDGPNWHTVARAVLARWGTPNLEETRSSPQPIPVSERLPRPTAELSPAAQAVMNAYVAEDRAGRLAVAAALHAAVLQAIPKVSTGADRAPFTPILAIAAELERADG